MAQALTHAIVSSLDEGATLKEVHGNYPGLTIPQIKCLVEFAIPRGDNPFRESTARRNLPHRSLTPRLLK